MVRSLKITFAPVVRLMSKMRAELSPLRVALAFDTAGSSVTLRFPVILSDDDDMGWADTLG